ncbi:magnesium transporter NIPA-domain-containing protein [Flammula alnicola]|nr:magnesium transporter NIPA-domain-containing protein [Flammula alnicola]
MRKLVEGGAIFGYDDLPQVTTRAFIGIVVAVSGNILISLALNLQKLAHKRVEKMLKVSNNRERRNGPSIDERDEDHSQDDSAIEDGFSSSSTRTDEELQPLTASPAPVVRGYGTNPRGAAPARQTTKVKRSFASRFSPFRIRKPTPDKFLLPVDIMSEDAALHGLPTRKKMQRTQEGNQDVVEESEGKYLKSKLWWMGFLLMNVGEMGNFISYAFAPASVVAPLGTFALMANCFFAPLLLGEHFRKRDLIGVAIAILGAVTVVLASNASDTRLDPDGLLRAISQLPFLVYSCVYVAGAIILATLSEGAIGKKWVFIDIGLCSIFGGFTVLSTKALSTLLTLQWIEIFTNWITYPLIAVLVLTGVGQIRYLNRALMRFDSKVVIPIQFVLFTLSAIIGSAILYGDFQKAKFHQVVTFLYGCAATFAGVFIIAWTPKGSGRGDLEDVTAEPDDTNTSGDPALATTPDGAHLGLGTIGRRRRATLVLPSGVTSPGDTPVLRNQRSGIGMMGISPAQRLLLVHTPPREIPVPLQLRDSDGDFERGARTPESAGRRRTMSWYGHESGNRDRSGNRTRDSSITGRLRSVAGRVGSLDEHSNTTAR